MLVFMTQEVYTTVELGVSVREEAPPLSSAWKAQLLQLSQPSTLNAFLVQVAPIAKMEK